LGTCKHQCQVRLHLADGAYGATPTWAGWDHWVNHDVPQAYDDRYREIRPLLIDDKGTGGVGRRACIAVAKCLAAHADARTGRDCRVLNAQIAADTGLTVRTVTRARRCLSLLGVAT